MDKKKALERDLFIFILTAKDTLRGVVSRRHRDRLKQPIIILSQYIAFL